MIKPIIKHVAGIDVHQKNRRLYAVGRGRGRAIAEGDPGVSDV